MIWDWMGKLSTGSKDSIIFKALSLLVSSPLGERERNRVRSEGEQRENKEGSFQGNKTNQDFTIKANISN